MPLFVDWTDLEHAFEFVSTGQPHEYEAVVCRESGTIFWKTDIEEDIEAWPDDADDAERYLAIPHKSDLGLGKPLALKFAEQFLPEMVVLPRRRVPNARRPKFGPGRCCRRRVGLAKERSDVPTISRLARS